jgi:hypothetical protein
MQKQPQQLFQASCALLEFSRIFTLCISLLKVAKKALKSYDFKAFSWSECNYRISENTDISMVCWWSARGIHPKLNGQAQ